MLVKVLSTEVILLARDELLTVTSDRNWVERSASDDDVLVNVPSTVVMRLAKDELLSVMSDLN